jgi:hypothetical protein
MSGIATAIGVGAVASAYIGSQASQSAANTEANAANNASAVQMSMFNQEQANEQPYMTAGAQSLSDLQGQMSTLNQPFTMSQFQEDPGYQFDLQQGQSALQNSAAASGHMISSQELGNASNYSQSMASNEFNNAFNRYQTQNQSTYNRLMGMVQVGQAGASNTNAAAMNAGNNISANTIGAGNAAAAAQVGTANAITGGIGSAVNGLTGYSMFNTLNNNQQAIQQQQQTAAANSIPSYGSYTAPEGGYASMSGLLA